MMSDIPASEHYTIFEAADGLEALRIIDETNPDLIPLLIPLLILLDLLMPKMGAIDLLIACNSAENHVPIGRS